MHPGSLLSLALLASALHAQCAKPAIPAAGLPVYEARGTLVTYGDGYRTRGDLIWPNVTPPTCGWPLVIYVHGLGSNRGDDRGEHKLLAARGYVVWAYDVRGQGEAVTLNAPTAGHTFDGGTEKYDLAEQIAFARALFAPFVSQTLVAVTGFSQGAITSWGAAALSERLVVAPGRPLRLFPKIAAVAPHGFTPEPIDIRVPEGALFEASFVDYVAGNTFGTVLAASFMAQAQSAFLQQDPAGLRLAYQLEPSRPVSWPLSSTQVPILYSHALYDGIRGPLAGMLALTSLSAATPWRAVLGTGGHGAPENEHESAFRRELRVRWLDRFLWNEPNGVEHEARVVTFVPPLDAQRLGDPKSLWSQRADASFPAPDVVATQLFTRDTGTLDPQPPASSGAPTTITNQVAASYNQQVYLASSAGRATPTVLQNIPLSERAFATYALPVETEVCGVARASLSVVPSTTRFALTASLVARAPGATSDLLLASQAIGVAQATPGTPMTLAFDVGVVVSVLPAGTVVKLVLRNHWLRDAPMAPEIVTAPVFHSFSVQIRHGKLAGEASTITLPVRTRARASLVSASLQTPVATPAAMSLELRGGTTRGGASYVVLGTLSGHDPQSPFALRLDSLATTLLGLANTPLLPGFAGVLGTSGDAAARFDLTRIAPLPPVMAGTRLSFAGLVLDPSGPFPTSATNPVDLLLR